MQNKTLERPVAIITGAASGIGLALSKACLQQEFDVALLDINASLLSMRKKELINEYNAEVVIFECDVTNSAELNMVADKVFKHFKRIDLLINNAGISGKLAPIWEQDVTHIKKVLNVNLLGAIHCIQAFLPKMLQQAHRSHIVNIASVYGLCNSSNTSVYAMSKHAMVALTESLYFDLKRLNKPVDASVVCPSFVNTQLLVDIGEEADQLHMMMMKLMEHSRSADDVAQHIMKEIKKKVFYILPDREVKEYCEQRLQAILHQKPPFEHSLEKIMSALTQRAQTKKTNHPGH